VENWAKEFGQRVYILRKEFAKINQGQFAKRLGQRSPTAVTRLERGKTGRINLDILAGLVALANENGHDANWLLTGKEAAKPDVTTVATSLKNAALAIVIPVSTFSVGSVADVLGLASSLKGAPQ